MTKSKIFDISTKGKSCIIPINNILMVEKNHEEVEIHLKNFNKSITFGLEADEWEKFKILLDQ